MRIILSCILSCALVLCSTPIAYADERVSSGFSGSSTNEHRCLLSNRAGSSTDAEDRTSSGGRSLATSTPQASSSCVICNIIGTSSDDSLLGSRGITSYLSASSLASSSSGVASLLSSLSDTLNSGLANLSLVSLFTPTLAYADDGEGEEEAEEELNEEGLNVDGFSGTNASSESTGEFASDDSSSDDLSEDSEEVDFAITPLASSSSSSITVEWLVAELLFRIADNWLDFSADTVTEWLYDVLGIEVIDYTEELYDLINIDIYGLLTQIRMYTADISTDIDLSYQILVNIYDYLTGHIFNALYDPTYDFTIDGYHSWLELIYDLLDEHLPYLEDIDTLLSNIGSDSPDFQLSLEFNTSYVYLFGYDSDLVSEWSIYYISSSGEHVLMDTSISEELPFGFPDGYETLIFYGRILDDSGVYDVYYYTPYYFADDATWTFYEIADQGVYGIYEILRNLSIGNLTDYSSTLADILDAIENISVEVDVSVDDSSFSIWDLLIGAVAVGTITSALSSLATSAEDTFPIGALVMIAQFLVLLDTDPVAPVYSGEIYGVTVEIDLSPYDNMALICRYMLFALYVIGLYKSTKDWAFPVDGD